MDAEEYFKNVTPGAMRSSLDPFWPAIKKARSEGYTLKQIVDFLKTNSVTITVAGLSVYIRRREAKESAKAQE